MKKLFSFLMLMLLPMVMCAQEIYEEDLAGTWILESSEGEFVYKDGLARPDILELYTESQHQTENNESLGVARFQSPEAYTKYVGIQDYFIYDCSGGNLRLHIQYYGGHYVVRYIVNFINHNRMELQTYDKKGKVVFVRQEDPSSVASVTQDTNKSITYYSLKGEQLLDTPSNGIYIHNGKKYFKNE